jgi:hypothetical protein
MSDYILFLDADMVLDVKNFYKETLLEYDSFTILQGSEDFYFQNMRIVKNNGLYSYVGVTHEYINTPQNNVIYLQEPGPFQALCRFIFKSNKTDLQFRSIYKNFKIKNDIRIKHNYSVVNSYLILIFNIKKL